MNGTMTRHVLTEMKAASDLFSEMNQICFLKQNTLGRGKLLISEQDYIFMFK